MIQPDLFSQEKKKEEGMNSAASHHNEALETARREFDSGGTEVVSMCVDVTDLEAVTSAVGEIQASLGGIDVLVNCAGIYRHKSIQEMSGEEWDQTLNVNLKGVFAACKAVGPSMANQESGGAIVNLASIAAQRGSPLHAHYCASKAGIIGFGRTLALELAPKVRVNAVAPGYIDTDMVAAVPANVLEKIITRIPVGRLGKAEEIARGVAFLVADDAGFVTGSTLSINGGQHMY